MKFPGRDTFELNLNTNTMGTFIPVQIEGHNLVSSYAKYLDRLKQELEDNSFRSLSRFCFSYKISYPEFKRYLNDNGFNFSLLKKENDDASSVLPTQKSAALSSVTIKLSNRTEIYLSSVLPSQLLQIIKAL